MAIASQQYNVGGILLARPFKVRRLGHFGFNADKVAEGLEFYNALLGFKISDELDFAKVPGFPEQVKALGDARGFFMRHGTDHHSFVLFNQHVMGLRPDRKFRPEMTEARHAKGIDVLSGHRYEEKLPAQYDVEGVLLPRPFKITKIGPVHLFVDDVDAAEMFYTNTVGFVKAEESVYQGARCVFLRAGSEHHSLALFPKELRATLGFSPHTTCKSFGVEVGSYQQLREAIAFLKSHGVTMLDPLPPELSLGTDYVAHALDPDGHCIQLYYYMEQVGWDGRVRPQSQRRRVTTEWPEALEPLSDTYTDQVFQSPVG